GAPVADLQPDYKHCSPSLRWSGPLHLRRGALVIEANRHRGQWAFRILPGGACIGARLLDGTLYIRISRSTRPAQRHLPKWERELSVFVEKLNLSGWTGAPDFGAPGVAHIYSCPAALLCKCGSRLDD